MCYEEGVLQAFLDGELEEGKRREIKEHLEVCSRCQNIYQELKDNDVFVAEKLGGFKRAFRKNEVELKDSWNKFLIKASRVDSNKRRIIMKKWKKPLIAGVAGLVILTSLTFSPVQGIASDLLKVFRVSKLETVNLTLDDLTEIRNALSSQEGKIDLASLGKAEAVGNRENIASYEGEEAWNQLKNISDFKVKLPYYLPESIKTGSRTGGSGNSIIGIIDENGEFIPQTEGENTSQFRAFVEDGFAINFDLNVKNVNNVLKSLGGTKFLPEEIDNKTFTIKVPMVVQFYIGNGSQYLNITEAKSPEVIVPQDVDEEQLRLALLDLPIIPQRVRNQLAGINDWRNTLIVPNIEGSAEEVRVNGSEAVYIKNEQGGSLIWQENGVIYTIDSNLSKEEILKIAVEMR